MPTPVAHISLKPLATRYDEPYRSLLIDCTRQAHAGEKNDPAAFGLPARMQIDASPGFVEEAHFWRHGAPEAAALPSYDFTSYFAPGFSALESYRRCFLQLSPGLVDRFFVAFGYDNRAKSLNFLSKPDRNKEALITGNLERREDDWLIGYMRDKGLSISECCRLQEKLHSLAKCAEEAVGFAFKAPHLGQGTCAALVQEIMANPRSAHSTEEITLTLPLATLVEKFPGLSVVHTLERVPGPIAAVPPFPQGRKAPGAAPPPPVDPA
jgi:hypothetical protein